MPEISIDSRQFRVVMGRFATGVTTITVAVDQQRRGMTANAVASLSLHPPLLLVCVDRNSSMHGIFEVAEAFAVNVLAADQRAVSEFFAGRSGVRGATDPMGGYPYHHGPLGSPILDGTLAWVECRVSERYAGGDHTIIVGRVESMEVTRPDAGPLLFYSGRYRFIDGEIEI